MQQAIAMPLEERQERHASLLRGVVERDVEWWSAAYLAALDQARA